MKLFISRAVLFLGIALSSVSLPAFAFRHNVKHPHRAHRKKDGHSPVKHHPYKIHRRHTATTHTSSKPAVVRAHRVTPRKKLSETPQSCPVALMMPQKSAPALGAWAGAAVPSVVTEAQDLESPAQDEVASTAAPAEPAATVRLRTRTPNSANVERPLAPSPLRTLSVPSDMAEATESAPLRIRPVYPSAQSRVAPEKDNRPPVTLVYKDGRAEKILNYLLSPTLLCILDGNRDSRYRDIPVEELDLEATEKANQAVGIEFALPKIPE